MLADDIRRCNTFPAIKSESVLQRKEVELILKHLSGAI